MERITRYDILQRLSTVTELMNKSVSDIPTKDEDKLCDNVGFYNFETLHKIAGEYISMVRNMEYEEE